MDSGDHLQKMLQNTVNQNPQPTAMHRLEAVFGKFLDVQGVTGSSPVSSTKATKSELIPYRGWVRICPLSYRHSTVKKRGGFTVPLSPCFPPTHGMPVALLPSRNRLESSAAGTVPNSQSHGPGPGCPSLASPCQSSPGRPGQSKSSKR